MRKFLVMAVAATAGLLVAAPAMVPATAAVAASHDVLTIRKVGGNNVKVGAILKASLQSGTKATFLTPGDNFVKCSSVSFTAKVTKNPRAKGSADESLTSQVYKKCTTNIAVATGRPKVVLNKLPYKTTLSDSKGDPVTVSGTTATISVPSSLGGTLVCHYGAKQKKTHGSASNATQTIGFSNQPFRLTSGPEGCPTSGKFTATFGPVKDTSVKGDPHVFVN
jgi:hypothetical protein